MWFRRLFYAPLLAALTVFRSFAAVLLRSIRPPADLTLSLNHLARDAAAFGRDARSRFESFVDRARAHDLFTAGHFDPGRLRA